MAQSNMSALILVLLAFGQARATVTLANHDSKINPPLKDVSSDKKFFGPPFPADYPDDKRPAINHDILKQVKSPGNPYPALQGRQEYDADYVKDENSDKGAWQAQMEYDTLRRKLAGEEGDEKRAADRAAREGKDVDDAQKNADAAGKGVSDAEKGVDDASKEENDIKKASDFDGPPSREKLDELKKEIEKAKELVKKREEAFKECTRQLEEAKKELADLKAQQAAMEEKLNADTKLYIAKKEAAEQKAESIKLNLKRTKEEKAKAASAKVQAAQAKVTAAEKVKADMDKALAKEKAEHVKAQDDLKKAKDHVADVQRQLDAAGAKLQELHGFKPQVVPGKSDARMNSVLLSLAMVVAAQLL